MKPVLNFQSSSIHDTVPHPEYMPFTAVKPAVVEPNLLNFVEAPTNRCTVTFTTRSTAVCIIMLQNKVLLSNSNSSACYSAEFQ